ncbi:MAG: hypothetical protein GY866_26980 [Proteobacteria bacterium]|nr:hypothetical protein [Pseudomonadota bacterium]
MKKNTKFYLKSLLMVFACIFLMFSCGETEEEEDDEQTASSKAITSFQFLAADNTALSADVDGSIDESAKTIALSVPNGTTVTALTPTIVMTGSSVSPSSGASQDFTNSVVYTVTAEDGTTSSYTATVTIAGSSGSSNCVLGTSTLDDCTLQ